MLEKLNRIGDIFWETKSEAAWLRGVEVVGSGAYGTE